MLAAMRQTMSPAMRHEMKMLQQLAMELRSPAHPNATRGLEGIAIAHKILQERSEIGLLIGGVAEAVWNRKRTPQELLQHKDVDVLVPSSDFDVEPFEEGIDWWVTKNDTMDITNSTGGRNLNVAVRWHQNMNDVVLRFLGGKRGDLPSGLYIPSPDWITNMRGAEMEASIDPKVGIEDGALEMYMRKVASRMRKTLMPALKESHCSFILAKPYETDEGRMNSFYVQGQEWEHLSALRRKETIDRIGE